MFSAIGSDRGIDGAVEHHGPHAVGVPLGVGGAELGAVGEAEVVDLVLPQRRPHDVHVLGGRRGPDVGQEVLARSCRCTLLGDVLVELLDARDARGAVVGHRLAPVGVELGVAAAAHLRGRMADAARVEADQVEAPGDVGVGQCRGHAGDGVDGRRSWAAGIDHQDADAITGGGHPDDRQLRLWPVGLARSRPAPRPCRTGRSGSRRCLR